MISVGVCFIQLFVLKLDFHHVTNLGREFVDVHFWIYLSVTLHFWVIHISLISSLVGSCTIECLYRNLIKTILHTFNFLIDVEVLLESLCAIVV